MKFKWLKDHPDTIDEIKNGEPSGLTDVFSAISGDEDAASLADLEDVTPNKNQIAIRTDLEIQQNNDLESPWA